MMDLGIDKVKLQQYRAAAARLLGDPVRMRLTLVIGMTVLALLAVYVPLSGRIDRQRRLLAAENRRFEAVRDVESLRREVERYRPRIGAKSDTNEWVQYLLAGMRQTKVELRDMGSKEPQRVGPYKAVALTLEVQGDYGQMKEFMEWLEQSDRLLRVEAVRIDRLPGTILMRVNILGLAKTNA